MIQDFIMKIRSLLIVNCDNREYAPMNDLENPSRLLTYSPVLLVYLSCLSPSTWLETRLAPKYTCSDVCEYYDFQTKEQQADEFTTIY